MEGLRKVAGGWNGVMDGFAQKLGEVSLWNDEIGEGLMTKKIKSKLDGNFFFIN